MLCLSVQLKNANDGLHCPAMPAVLGTSLSFSAGPPMRASTQNKLHAMPQFHLIACKWDVL